jgi:hypothetical protein
MTNNHFSASDSAKTLAKQIGTNLSFKLILQQTCLHGHTLAFNMKTVFPVGIFEKMIVLM